MKSDGVQLILRPRRHVREGLPRGLCVLEDVLDGRLQVERLDQGGLVQGQRVANASNLEEENLNE